MRQITKNGLHAALVLIVLFSAFPPACHGEGSADPKNMVTAGANFFSSSTPGFRELYGSMVLMPEIKFTRLISGNISLWGAFGWISRQGIIEDVNEPAKIRQTMASIGAGYLQRLSACLTLRAEAGITYASFTEDALDETLKGSGLGWRVGANLDIFIRKRIFVTLDAAFSQAGDEVQTGKVKLGGFQLGAGFGIAF